MSTEKDEDVTVSKVILQSLPYCSWMAGIRCPGCRAIMRPYNIRMVDLGTGGDYALLCENPDCNNSKKVAVITDMFTRIEFSSDNDGDEYAWFDLV